MYKRGKVIILVLFLFLLVGSVNAINETNITTTTNKVDLAYDWLYEQMTSSNWNKNPSEISLAILALGGEGYDVTGGIDKLKDLKSENNWNNDIKDTSLAILALDAAGNNMSDEIEWLEEQHKRAMTGGNWYLQLDTPSSNAVDCRLTYDDSDYNFVINDSEITQISPDYCPDVSNWIDFAICIKQDENVNFYEEIGVNCVATVDSSIIYQDDIEYFIVDEGDPLIIENGCFYSQSGCNCDYTGYAGWILKEVGGDSYVNPYMRTKCKEVKGYSFLYSMSKDRFYFDWVKDKQNLDDGSWDSNLRTTYFALLGLKKNGDFSGINLNKAKEYLNYYQKEDGSWNQNVEDTAFILYILYSGDFRQPAPSIGCSIADGDECESDLNCNDSQKCGALCTCYVPSNATVPCGDGYCGVGESCGSCSDDCGTCPPTPDDTSPSGDGEDSSWVKWLVIILSILLGLAIIYYIYMKYFKGNLGAKKPGFGGPKQPPKSPFKMGRQRVSMGQPRQPITSSRREEAMEKELEESLKKAKDMLKK